MASKAGTVRTTRRRLRLVDPVPADPGDHTLSAALPRLATALDEAAEQEGWGQPPLLVRITEWSAAKAPSEGFDLGVRPIDDGSSVVEALAGFTAPAEWSAIGVVTEGNARHLVQRDERRRVRCVHLVDRTGASGGTLRLQGEDATILSGGDEHKPSGRIDDACRRALGLPTAPPAHTSTELWAIVWLERLLEHRGCAPSSMRFPWREAAGLHPAIALVVAEDPTSAGEAAQQLGRLGEVLAQVHSWPVLRMACAAGDWPVDGVPAAVAAWLDDGAFSRWVLGELPRLDQLAAAACEVVPPSVARRVRAVLSTWELPIDST
ncbi:MAG: hypothetical protein QOD92_2623 [Acidimicrobiaceae bacterium]|jgi:hypothetical protein